MDFLTKMKDAKIENKIKSFFVCEVKKKSTFPKSTLLPHGDTILIKVIGDNEHVICYKYWKIKKYIYIHSRF